MKPGVYAVGTIPITIIFYCNFWVRLISSSPVTPPVADDGPCPGLQSMVYNVVYDATRKDPRAPASLLRLHFHDCFVSGCDGSILLDAADGEQFVRPNLNSIRGMEYINQMKSLILESCGNVVSCADLLALAARDSVSISGGPWWRVALGRQDSLRPFPELVSAIPLASDTIEVIREKFEAVGLGTTEHMVVLSGAHTFGMARCVSFVDRLYNFDGTERPDATLNGGYLWRLRSACRQGGDLNGSMVLLDVKTGYTFDNAYFQNLEWGLGLLISDQRLYSSSTALGQAAARLVRLYASDQRQFFGDFATAMVGMGRISPTYNEGEIRINCNMPNSRQN